MTWIKTQYQIPEPDKRVLVANSLGHIGVGELLRSGHWVCDEIRQIYDVTHWMPLPKHPQDSTTEPPKQAGIKD